VGALDAPAKTALLKGDDRGAPAMKKILIVLLIFGLAWAYTPTRARMLLAAQPVLERMGPVGEKIVTPIHRYNTHTEVSFIADQIVLARTEGRDIPDERTFHRWMMKQILTKNQGKDAWGFPYFLVKVGSSITVGSIGADGQRGTADDIKKTVRI
jgi:hypothetical protein